MIPDDSNPSSAAPIRTPSNDVSISKSEDLPLPLLDPAETQYARPPDLSIPPTDSPQIDLPQFDASVPEDERAPWGGLDLFLFIGFGFLGLVVAFGIVVGIAVFAFHIPIRDLGQSSTTSAKSMIAVLAQGVWSGFVLLYFFVMVRVRTQAPFWRTMGWRGLHLHGQTTSASIFRCLGGGAMLALIVSFAGKFINEKGELPIEEMFHSRPTVILLMGLGILVAPLVEETMFRGFLYPILARRLGMTAGVILTGVLFGAMHAQQLWGGWGQITLLIGVGILLTWVRARTGTVTASYFVHLGYNSLLFLGFFIATGGLRHIPGGS
jgi:membrane protease YdiL (CAAX protease family)